MRTVPRLVVIIVLMLGLSACRIRPVAQDPLPPDPSNIDSEPTIEVSQLPWHLADKRDLAKVRLNGEPVGLPEEALQLSWSHGMLLPRARTMAVIDVGERNSTLIDLVTGRTLATSEAILESLADQRSIFQEWLYQNQHLPASDPQTPGSDGPQPGSNQEPPDFLSLDEFFVVTGWVTWTEPLGYLEVPEGGAAGGGPNPVRHAFSLTRLNADGYPTHSIIGWFDASGRSFLVDAAEGIPGSIVWSPPGNYLAYVAGLSNDNLIGVAAVQQTARVLSISGSRIAKTVSPGQVSPLWVPTICHQTIGWSVDERILAFGVTVQDNPSSQVWSCRVDITGENLTVETNEDEEDIYARHRTAFDEYWNCIIARDPALLPRIPEYVRLPYGGHLYLRQNAQDYFSDTNGNAVNAEGFHLVAPRSNSTIENPCTVRLWHAGSHYAGGILLIIDSDDNILAKYHLPEVAAFNEVLRPLTVTIPYLEPKTQTGYIVGLRWDSKDGEQTLSEGCRVPCRFR